MHTSLENLPHICTHIANNLIHSPLQNVIDNRIDTSTFDFMGFVV